MNENITPLPWKNQGGNICSATACESRGRIEIPAPVASVICVAGRSEQNNANTAYIVEACNAYPALTARVKELEEENARLRKDFGKIFVSFLQDDRDGVGEIFTGVYTLDFTTGEPVFADSALNKEPTT